MTVSRQPLFWAVSLGHLTVDMFSGMAPVLLAFLSAHLLPMSNTQIGVAVSAYALAGALSQPFFGWRGDRSGGRLLGAGGVAWTVGMLALAMIIAQLTRSYPLMLVPYVLAALGSGAFHPVGAMHASEVEAHRAATNTSMFFMMGQLGLALGPTLAGVLLDRFATHNALFTRALGPVFAHSLLEGGSVAPILGVALITVPAILFMALSLPTARAHRAQRAEHARKAAASARSVAIPVSALALLALVVAMRSLINPGIGAFVPRLFQLKGWEASGYGMVMSAFWLGGGLAGVYLGQLADRHDSRLLVAVTLVLSAPALFLLTVLDGVAAIGTAMAVGALSGGSHSLLVLQAQRLLPAKRGLATGMILGFMFATGALGSLAIGAVSDHIGLPSTFHIVAAVTVVTGLLGLALPSEKPRGAGMGEASAATSAAD